MHEERFQCLFGYALLLQYGISQSTRLQVGERYATGLNEAKLEWFCIALIRYQAAQQVCIGEMEQALTGPTIYALGM